MGYPFNVGQYGTAVPNLSVFGKLALEKKKFEPQSCSCTRTVQRDLKLADF